MRDREVVAPLSPGKKREKEKKGEREEEHRNFPAPLFYPEFTLFPTRRKRGRGGEIKEKKGGRGGEWGGSGGSDVGDGRI